MKLSLCVVLFAICAVNRAQQDHVPGPDYPSWQDDYIDLYDNYFNEGEVSNEYTQLKQTEPDTLISSETQDVKKQIDLQGIPEKEFDVMADYQIEDNRSNSDEKEHVEENKQVDEEPMPDDAPENENNEELAVVPLTEPQEAEVLMDGEIWRDVIEEPQDSDVNEGKNEEGNIDLSGIWGDVVKKDSMPDEAAEDENNEELAIAPLTEPQEHEVMMDGGIWHNLFEEPQENDDNQEINEEEVNLDSIWGTNDEDAVAPLPVPKTEDSNGGMEHTKEIVNGDIQNFDDQQSAESVEEENPEQGNIDKIIEETDMLLKENEDAFEPNDYNNFDEQEQEKSEEDFFSESNDEIEEDTPQKVYADLNADLDKLFETLDKLSEDDSDKEEEADEDNAYVDNVQDYEEKYGIPYKEGVVLNWRDSEANAAEQNYPDESDETADSNNNRQAEDNEASNEQDEADDYENLDDSNLSEIFAENAFAEIEENNKQELFAENESNNDTANENNISGNQNETLAVVEATFDYVDNINDSLDNEPSADDDINSVIKQVFSDDIKEPQSYGNDALIDENQPKNLDAEEFNSIKANDTKIEDIEQSTVMVDDLSSAELSDLMTQFAIAHSEDLDVHSEDFAKNIAPVHITLSVDEPTVVTSPNYPEFYPTNNIVDWIFEGPGTGIELNITDFAVNGALGDYLLVKPGGLDASGNDGLIFSYRLNSERRYRFADVNRMFVRFEAKPGWQFMRGFSFSVKMIWPLPELAIDVPEPEAVINPPQETLTLNLAGLTLQQFNEIKQEFIELVADMASAYIKDHDIDRGLNTTFEVTQITRTAVCNIRWPNYETCVEVAFGVPLQYEEGTEAEPRLTAEELDTMWTSYIIQEQFASRLRSLGITEYAIPNDRTVLMVWLVIASGVVISMAMLAFALWRFSCFEDYTRMRAYSDTDSIQNEKRNLDLYPTPHQTLPPLYTENDYKWADDKYDDSTRVDMGGFANKSYIRDELFDLDSDEDVITTRDRNGVISPRDIYEV